MTKYSSCIVTRKLNGLDLTYQIQQQTTKSWLQFESILLKVSKVEVFCQTLLYSNQELEGYIELKLQELGLQAFPKILKYLQDPSMSFTKHFQISIWTIKFNRSHFFHYDKSWNGKRYQLANVVCFWHLVNVLIIGWGKFNWNCFTVVIYEPGNR